MAKDLTKFKIKSDDITEDLNVIYHRKILDKIQKYTAKIKTIKTIIRISQYLICKSL